MYANFCVEALEEALAQHGRPKIFDNFAPSATGSSAARNQGSQLTGDAFTRVLKNIEFGISMDGRGRWMRAGAIGTVEAGDCRRSAATKRPVIPHKRPESTGLAPA